MAYETKVILMMLARIAARAKSIKDVYNAIADAANAEGVVLKPYEEFRTELEEE